jgi:hypothetical protein
MFGVYKYVVCVHQMGIWCGWNKKVRSVCKYVNGMCGVYKYIVYVVYIGTWGMKFISTLSVWFIAVHGVQNIYKCTVCLEFISTWYEYAWST